MGENQEGGLSQKPGEEIVSQKKESSTSLAGGGGGGVTSSRKPSWTPSVGLRIPRGLGLPFSAYLSPRLAWECHKGRDKV